MCSACTKSALKKGKSKPNCEACQYAKPEIHEDNLIFLWFLNKISSALWDGMGGLNVQLVDSQLSRLSSDGDFQSVMWEKLMIYVSELKKEDAPATH